MQAQSWQKGGIFILEEDLKLVEQILKGNLDSFNILVNKYEFPVLKFVYNMIRNKEASEDITQEVFITLYKKLYTFNMHYKFSSWLFQIARNKSIDYIRKYKRVYEASIEDSKEACSNDMSPETSAEFMETKLKVQGFVNRLESIDRDILMLRYSQDLTFSDIAEVLNLNEATVKRKYYKIRDRYKELYDIDEMRCNL